MTKKLYFGTNLKMYKTIADTTSYLQKLAENTNEVIKECLKEMFGEEADEFDRLIRQTIRGINKICKMR